MRKTRFNEMGQFHDLNRYFEGKRRAGSELELLKGLGKS